MCWRQCGAIGTLTHIFWEFSKITDLALTPAIALLRIFPTGLEKGEEFVLHHTLLAARASIARLWKTITAPSVAQVLKDAQYNMTMEELLDYDIKRSTQNTALWKVWRRTQVLEMCRQMLNNQGANVSTT
ncbi:hypothetical protein XELAEV_18038932mg [Xenopus laevis]|uniref:Uncharacterized protein n=1 Tax=Xenopus laevis TaxID=8355 RepID=A0A974C6X3_XENLA|nr:hypothetical protein XELAEV_18038932mg [Xenopus laevis]